MRGIAIGGSSRVVRPFLARLRGAGIAAEALEPGAAEGLAAGIDCLILAPRGAAELEELLFEKPAYAKRPAGLRVIVIAATLSPRHVKALRGRIPPVIALVDAPYTGTLRAAQEGSLSFLLGGGAAELAELAPVFDRLGREAVTMGGFGAAMAAKAMNDLLAASANAMTRIALDWAEAQGIDETRLMEMAGDSLAGLVPPGYDPGDDAAFGLARDDCIATLVRKVEGALDHALKGAHLTPPRALEDSPQMARARALH